jgi:hypothetical protein
MILFNNSKSNDRVIIAANSIISTLVSASFAGIFAVILSKTLTGYGFIGVLIVISYYILLTIFIGRILTFDLNPRKSKERKY